MLKPHKTDMNNVDECSEDDIKQNARKKLRKDCLSEKQLPSAELNTAAEKPAADVILATQTSASDFVRTDQVPSARWGHALCMISESDAILIGGQGDKNMLCKDAVWQLDMLNRKWSVPDTVLTTSKPEARTGHSVIHSPMARCLYVYGGSKNKKWFSDVYMVDTDNWTWHCIRANGNPPSLSYHSCTLYGQEMWVFGGIYPRPDPLPDDCSNELYVFNLFEENWYKPLVMGIKPSTRSGHSATLFDSRLVVFGGWDAPVCYNDLFILDLSLVEWSQPQVNGRLPSARCWHASCALAGNRLFIHGGYNGNSVLADSFIFELDSLTWSTVEIEPAIAARTGHTAVCCPLQFKSRDYNNVVVFGGGDNEGKFFSDLFCISVPTSIMPSVKAEILKPSYAS